MKTKGRIDRAWHELPELAQFELPEKFTFPFSYKAHPAAIAAAEHLQSYLQQNDDFPYDFGINGDQKNYGKMLGVLVVKNQEGQLGYIAGFSGQLGDQSTHPYFVPPLIDLMEKDSYFNNGMQRVTEMTREIDALSERLGIDEEKDKLKQLRRDADADIARLKQEKRAAKLKRDEARESMDDLSEVERDALVTRFANESQDQQVLLKKAKKYWRLTIEAQEQKLAQLQAQIKQKTEARSKYSNSLQQWLFEHYNFLNARGEWANVGDIFKATLFDIPPSGAGDCAAPRMLQHAYEMGYEPICMAEFWWGKSPSSEVRKHGVYYPACRGKCEPILGHMLQGLKVDDNPLLMEPEKQEIPIIYEDDDLMVINKPTELLSVPGRKVKTSAYTWFLERCPEATGPIVVHRLDMSTSGLLVFAKNKRTHEALQAQFISRKTFKRYAALLAGVPEADKGEVRLPLTFDYINRPRQMVSYEEGKPAHTTWEKVEVKDGQSKVYLYPHTGRTHQLRVHMSHKDGLNMAIVGDDLYGERGERLMLHARDLHIIHPKTKEKMTFTAPEPF